MDNWSIRIQIFWKFRCRDQVIKLILKIIINQKIRDWEFVKTCGEQLIGVKDECQTIYLPFREQALLHVLSVKSQYSAFAQSSLTRHSKMDLPLLPSIRDGVLRSGML